MQTLLILKVYKEEGIELGIQKGKEEGEYNKALEIAKNLIDILDTDTIRKFTVDKTEDIFTAPYQIKNNVKHTS